MGMPNEQQMIQMPVYPVNQPIMPEADWAHQVLHWIEMHVWGGATTLLISALIGLPVVLMFMFRGRIMLFVIPIAEFILNTSKQKRKE